MNSPQSSTANNSNQLTQEDIDYWFEKLKHLSDQQIRIMITILHQNNEVIFRNYIKDNTKFSEFIDDFIKSERKNIKSISGKNLKYLKDYTNTYSKAILKKNFQEKENLKINPEILRKIAVEAIIFIYYAYGNLKINKETDELIIYNDKEFLKSINILSPSRDNETNKIFYSFKYWRSIVNYEDEKKISKCLLELDFEKGYAIFTDMHGDEFEGDILKAAASLHGDNISIFLKKQEKGQSYNIFFHLSDDVKKNSSIFAIYSKERRRNPGLITSGVALLEKINSRDDFDTNLEDDHKSVYSLRRKRLDVNKDDYPEYAEEIAGIYFGNTISLNPESSSYSKFLLVLDKDGSVIIYTSPNNKGPKPIYIGNFKIISLQNNNKFIVINFDFFSDENSINKAYQSFRFVLKQEWSSNIRYLQGVRISSLHEDRIFPVATKVILEKQTSSIISKIRILVDKDNPEKYITYLMKLFFSEKYKFTETLELKLKENLLKIRSNLLKEIGSVVISGINKEEEKVLGIFNNNTYQKDFFLNYTNNNTDAYSIYELRKLMPKNVPFGHYDCYCFTLKGNKKILDYSSQKDAVIIRYPIKIEKNGKARIRIINKDYNGKASVNEDNNELSIVFYNNKHENDIDGYETVFMSFIFHIPSASDGISSIPDKLSGTLIKTLRDKAQNEGRVCVIVKINKPFESNYYEDNIYFNSFQFLRKDRETAGVLSHLIGPINRIARAERYIDEFHPRNESNSFKSDLFYSACYLAIKGASEDSIKERLFQAHIHGFAQTYFKGELNESEKSLIKEKLELKQSVSEKGVFWHNKNLVKYINELWPDYEDKIAKEFNGIFSYKSEAVIIMPYDSANKNYTLYLGDQFTEKVLYDLFKYYHIELPKRLLYSKIFDLDSYSMCFSIGLFSNKLSDEINNSEIDGKYFKFIKDVINNKRVLMVADYINNRLESNEDRWNIYSANGSIIDYGIIAKIIYLNKTVLIIGGLEPIGTQMAGGYLASQWDKFMSLKDSNSNLPIMESNSFTCVFSVTDKGVVEVFKVIAL